jgi:hypothetical protein
MKRSASLALAALAGAVLVWLWRSPPEPAVESETPPATNEASPSRQPALRRPVPWTPLPRRASGAPVAPPPPAPAAVDVPPPAIVSGAKPVSSPSEVPLAGHPEWTRRLLSWAAADPEAAAAWAEERADPAERLEALQAVCFKVAEKDPAAALAMAETFALNEAPEVLENLVAQWAAADAYAALSWVEHRPAGEARDALMSRVAFAMAAAEPHEAARLVEEQMAPGRSQEEAAASVVHQWWLRDPAAATAWVEALPLGPLRERARQELATPW